MTDLPILSALCVVPSSPLLYPILSALCAVPSSPLLYPILSALCCPLLSSVVPYPVCSVCCPLLSSAVPYPVCSVLSPPLLCCTLLCLLCVLSPLLLRFPPAVRLLVLAHARSAGPTRPCLTRAVDLWSTAVCEWQRYWRRVCAGRWWALPVRMT